MESMSGKRDIKIHSIKFNFIMNVILKISQFVFPLITFPYVARVLGAEANGKIGFAASLVSYFALVASLGIPSYGVRKCAEVRSDREKLNRTVKELLVLNSICLVITYAVFIIAVLTVPKLQGEKALMFVTSASIIFNVLGVDWFYQAIEQYSYITVRNIIFKIIGIFLMFALVHSRQDYIIYAGITVFASVGSNILNLIRLKSYIDFRDIHIDKKQLILHLSPILMLFLYNATTTIFTNLDQVMLGFMTTDEAVGYYNSAIKIKNLLTGFITALGAVMLPRISFYLNNGEEDRFEELIKKSFSFILVCALPLSAFFTVKATEVIVFLAGDEYYPSGIIMKALMPAIVFIGLSSVTAWQLLIPLKKEKITVLGAVLGALTDLVINVLLIPRYGALGAAIGTTVAEGVVLVTHYINLRDIVNRTFSMHELLKTFGGTVAATAGLVLIDHFITYSNLFLNCLISAIVFFLIYAIILWTTKENIIHEYGRNILHRLIK